MQRGCAELCIRRCISCAVLSTSSTTLGEANISGALAGAGQAGAARPLPATMHPEPLVGVSLHERLEPAGGFAHGVLGPSSSGAGRRLENAGELDRMPL